jgi:hypothetical protein
MTMAPARKEAGRWLLVEPMSSVALPSLSVVSKQAAADVKN